MKRLIGSILIYIVMFSVVVVTDGLCAAVKIGDTEDDVIYKIDVPNAKLTMGGELTYYYDAGTVVFVDGKVSIIKLMTQEETRKLLAEKAAAKAARAAAVEKAREQRILKGTAEMKATLADEKFKEKSEEARLSYWETFQKKYPEVPVKEQIAALGKIAVKREEKIAVKRKVKSEDVEAIKQQIAEKEKEKKEIEAKSGMSRRGLRQRRLDLARLTEELADLRQQINEPSPPKPVAD